MQLTHLGEADLRHKLSKAHQKWYAARNDCRAQEDALQTRALQCADDAGVPDHGAFLFEHYGWQFVELRERQDQSTGQVTRTRHVTLRGETAAQEFSEARAQLLLRYQTLSAFRDEVALRGLQPRKQGEAKRAQIARRAERDARKASKEARKEAWKTERTEQAFDEFLSAALAPAT